MATNKIIVGTPAQNRHKISALRLAGIVDSPVMSPGIRMNTEATTDAILLPPGCILYQVALWCYGSAISSADISIGTVGDIGKFIASCSAMDADEVRIAGVVATNQLGVHGGCYFDDGGVIQIAPATGATADSTVKVLAWYSGSA